MRIALLFLVRIHTYGDESKSSAKPGLVLKNVWAKHLPGPFSVGILHKSIADGYRPVRVADGQITVRGGFIKTASWLKGKNETNVCCKTSSLETLKIIFQKRR